MNIRKVAAGGLMCLSMMAPCKAQQPVTKIASKSGVVGTITKMPSLITGVSIGITKNKNFTDILVGTVYDSENTITPTIVACNNYSWTKNLSTWVRGNFALANQALNSTVEVAPVCANKQIGKFNFSVMPAYALYNNSKTGSTTHGLSAIFQSAYSPTQNDKICLEVKCSSEPTKNISNTSLNNVNASYVVTWFHTISTK